MRVLLISTYELGRQPFGLASPAAWLRREGADVTCADLSVDPFPGEAAAGADLVAFYVPMHTATRLTVPLIHRVKALNPAATLCCYGLYAPVNAPYLRRLGADAILGGEFEEGLVSLCRRLREAPSAASQVEPLISLGRQQFLVPDRRGLPPLSRYAQLCAGDQPPRTVGYVEASRGCKHLCRHCPVVPVYAGKFRIVQPDVVLQDIRQQVEAGATHITFGDPDFFNGIGHALPLVRALHREHPQISYDVTIKVEHLLRHAEALPVLRETGCAMVTTAVESIDDRILAILDKGHTQEDFIEVVRLFRENGLVLNPTFIPFTPWTTLEGYRELLALLHDLDLADAVAPVQLTIRLLVPAGSRLLELPEVQALVGPFEAERLSHPWTHPDPRVDRLHREVTALVCEAGSRREAFAGLWGCAHRDSQRPEPLPDTYFLRPLATIPYLTEPWYC
ncbi:MAG: radical SAM protein [Candidatus Latescibacteria bacterium]|nr:radical SAM protein [Candidatus Latescibacterota bacterium]